MDYIDVLHQHKTALWDLSYNHYRSFELLSVQWWGLIALLVIMYYVWLRLLDKKRLLEIVLFGSFIAVMAVTCNIAGTTMTLWQMQVRLFPIIPAPFPLDFTVIPILQMLAYQYSSSWARYLLLSASASAINSFVIVPLFQAAGIFTTYTSLLNIFVVVLMIAIVARCAIMMVMRAQQNSREQASYAPQGRVIPGPAFKPGKDDDN